MERQGKAWGATSPLLVRSNFSLHLLDVKAGGFCSEHKHERKTNHFYVISGRLEVRQWLAEDGTPDVTMLGAGQDTSVPVGVWHQFYAPIDTVCLEVYEAVPVEEDIVRRSVGAGKE